MKIIKNNQIEEDNLQFIMKLALINEKHKTMGSMYHYFTTLGMSMFRVPFPFLVFTPKGNDFLTGQEADNVYIKHYIYFLNNVMTSLQEIPIFNGTPKLSSYRKTFIYYSLTYDLPLYSFVNELFSLCTTDSQIHELDLVLESFEKELIISSQLLSIKHDNDILDLVNNKFLIQLKIVKDMILEENEQALLKDNYDFELTKESLLYSLDENH